MRAVTEKTLFERESELALLERSLGRVARGQGSRILIEGPAGIGKSALVALACRRARELGIQVFGAEATEVGSRVAFGVARELLGDTAPTSPEPTGAPAGGDPRAVTARLAQAVIELAGEAPVLIAVDDLQWADPGTQRWLVELARRLASTPLVLVLATRSGAADEPGSVLDALLDDRRALVLRPAPLSADATAELLAARLGRAADAELAAAAWRATTGNPYLVRTLGDALRQAGGAGGLDAASWVSEVGSRAVTRNVSARLQGLDQGARAVAEAAAVVGDIGGIDDLAAIAGTDPAAAADAAGRLAAADLLRAADSTELSHPLVAATIRAGLGAERREELLRAAAWRLAGAGRVEEAAARLVELPPRADPAVAETMAEAAGLAGARGAPDLAVVLLRRALAEPPSPARIAAIRARLGEALLAVADPEAASVLEAALSEARGTERAAAARALALALVFAVRIPEAVDLLDRVASELRASDPITAEELEAQMLHYASLDSSLRERRVERLRTIGAERGASELAYRLRLVGLASESLGACEPGAETAALAERALAGGALLSSAPEVQISATVLLAQVGRLEVARGQLQDAISSARERGQTGLLSFSLGVHGEVLWRQGDLVAAETDLRAALELVDYRELATPFILRPLLETLLELGETAVAEAELRRAGLTGDLAEVVSRAAILHARGRVRAAAGAPRLALEDLHLAGESLRRFGVDSPAAVPWRGAAALILAGLGEWDEAVALSAEEVGLAERIGAPEVLGPALRVHGATLGPDGRETLERAVALLEASSARLEHARAIVDFGARLREDGEAGRARERLRDGGALAEELGATVLARRALAELARAGGRPRRQAARGARALTPAERRVASLAAQGLTNPQIAETLVLARKTIEMHLTTAYRKLGVHARAELPAALAPIERPGSGQTPG